MPNTTATFRPALLLSLALAVTACGGKQEAGSATPAGAAAMPPMEVEFITVETSDRHRTLQMPARIQAVRTAEVRARIDGILEQRVYREGSDVKAGDVLFRIDPDMMAANVDVAKAAVAEKQADAQVTAQTLVRMQALLKTNAISSQQYDEAVARQGQADAAVKAAQAALKRSEIDLEYATVRAPISGRAGRALVTEGELLSKDKATPLATIEQIDPVQVNFAQASADYLRFRQQMFGTDVNQPGKRAMPNVPIDLILEDGSMYPLKGKLLWTEFSIDPNTGSVLMRAEFPNPDGALLPGQFVGVRLPFAQAESALSVPQRAVMASANGQFVYRVTADNKVEAAPIEVGGLAGNDWLIKRGLNAGDHIIVNGLQKVRPGAVVKPVAAMPTPPVSAVNDKPQASLVAPSAADSAASQTASATQKGR